MAENPVLAALGPVVEALESLGIPYYVAGSIASSLYGVARLTADADLVAAVETRHADDLASALEDRYYVDAEMIRDAVVRRSMFNVVHLDTAMKVDVYVLKPDPWDVEAFRRRREDVLDDQPGARAFHVGTAEDILLAKLAWFRLGGEVSERQWNDVIGMMRVQRTALDDAHLDRWAKVIGVEDLLARARNEA